MPEQAEAVVKVLQGGVATKHDLDLAAARLAGRIDRLDSKSNLILVVAVLAVPRAAPGRLTAPSPAALVGNITSGAARGAAPEGLDRRHASCLPQAWRSNGMKASAGATLPITRSIS